MFKDYLIYFYEKVTLIKNKLISIFSLIEKKKITINK